MAKTRTGHGLMRFLFSGLGGIIGAGARIEIYETLELLLSNQVLLMTALQEIYRIESKDGKKKKEVRALAIQDCLTTIRSGGTLSDALANWVPDQEVQLIRAGERSGNLAGAFGDAIRIIEAKRKIIGAVAGGAIYPVILMSMISLLLYQIANNMVPQFERILPAERWTGAAVILKHIADFVNNYGLIALGVMGVFFSWIIWSMPRMSKSRIRKVLDRIPPWSIYRMLHGSTFLLNVAVMLRAGILLQESLRMMARGGSPWLRERVRATIEGISQGKNLGVALVETGYDFPDARAVQFIRILADQNGFDEKLTTFGERWLDQSVSGVQAASKAILGIGVAITGSLILLILGGVMTIQQIAQASA